MLAEKRDLQIFLAHENVAEPVRNRQCAQRPDRVRKQRVGAVEGIDIPSARSGSRPPRRLNGTAALERQLVKILFPSIERNPPFDHQAEKVAVSRDVVEPVVMHPDVRDVVSHPLPRAVATERQEFFLARRVILQNRRAIDEPLRPFGPSAGRVAAFDRKDRSGGSGDFRGIDREDFRGRGFPELPDIGSQVGRREGSVESDHRELCHRDRIRKPVLEQSATELAQTRYFVGITLTAGVFQHHA